MLNLAPEKMLFVAFIAMIVLGPEKLPEIARKVGKVMGELRRVSDGFQQELRQAMDDTTGASTVREVLHPTGELPASSPSQSSGATVGDEPPGVVAHGPEAPDASGTDA